MTHSLTNRLLLPALLRNTSGIDTPVKTVSAAQQQALLKLFAPLRGVLIPHIKLREAAHLDAPLNAQNRPPAQPVVGYTHQTNPVAPVPTADIQTVGL